MASTDVSFERSVGTDPQAQSEYIRRDVNTVEGEGQQLARALGWFSIGLGLAEVAAPGKLAQMIGMEESNLLLRSYGMRELMAGVGILSNKRPAGWMWTRVAGDVVDLATLGAALRSENNDRNRTFMAIAAVAGVTALDIIAGRQLTRGNAISGSVYVRKSITINRSPEDVYGFWRDFQNFGRFMKHVESVTAGGPGRSHWVAKAPAGYKVEWDAEIVDDVPGQQIAWCSDDGADVPNFGTVRFEPGPAGQGTIVRVEIEYQPPAGPLGAVVAKLFGEEPSQQVSDDLRRLKQLLETGEISTTEGQPYGPAITNFMRKTCPQKENVSE
ncbi:MAG: SRPBCC family protein [Bryobacterales bacterium]|nr:SRPBCC family protein [Bryobacterales bacterium]